MTKKICIGSIEFGDDYGDNTTTFGCDLPEGHIGDHQERGEMLTTNADGKYITKPYRLEWTEKDYVQENED